MLTKRMYIFYNIKCMLRRQLTDLYLKKIIKRSNDNAKKYRKENKS